LTLFFFFLRAFGFQRGEPSFFLLARFFYGFKAFLLERAGFLFGYSCALFFGGSALFFP